MKLVRRLLRVTIAIALLAYSCRFVNPVLISLENDKPSVSIGESHGGSMKNGKYLPNAGNNYKTVSYVFTALGRNAVNDKLRDLTLAVYDTLYKLHPDWKYLYGETGWKSGGKFWPHYTHQNGLVVDFMVPVKDRKGKSVRQTSNMFNRWAYGFEFDTSAKTKRYTIDFESMATHLYFLKKLAPKYELKIRRIIFEPVYLKKLYATPYGNELRDISFIYKDNWVRHDDHYHTEFSIVEKKK